jgi:hypothetical protein
MTNRITPYESGWLGLLVRQGICTAEEAREAQYRVAREAIEDLEKRRAAKRAKKKKRRED